MRMMTDAAADFSPEECAQYDVRCIPTGVMLDGETIPPEDWYSDSFWQRVLDGAVVKTSQPAPGVFQEAFEEAVNAGEEVLCINISSALSGTLQSARIAAAELESDLIHMVDSLTGAAAQKLLNTNIKGIWNFTGKELRFEEQGVVVENVHMGDSLMTLSYHMNDQQK